MRDIKERLPAIACFAALLRCVFILSASPIAPTTATWGLTWDQPTNMPVLANYVPGTNQAYKLYGTSTLGQPQANWPVLAVWTAWNVVTNGNGSISLSNNVTLPFGQYFLLLNPTNVFGEPPFSLGFWGQAQTGPTWSAVNNSALNKQGP